MQDNGVVNTVSHQLGVLSGKFDTMEKSIATISEAVQIIAGHSARVDSLEEDRIQHDKRIGKLEGENIELREKLTQATKQIDSHIEKDTPVEVQMGRYAWGIVIFVGGLVGRWLFDRITK